MYESGNTKAIQAAIDTLLRVCDGAHNNDGCGFNAYDAGTARQLKAYYFAWTHEREFKAWKMLAKYAKQLESRGIIYANLGPVPEPREGRTLTIMEDERDGSQTIAVQFPYNAGLVKAVKTIPGARYSGGSKIWFVRFTSESAQALREFAEGYDFEIDPAVQALFDRPAPEAPAPAPARRIVAMPNGDYRIIFKYDAELIARLKADLPANERKYDPQNYWWVAKPSAALLRFCDEFGFDGTDGLRAAVADAAQAAEDAAQASDALTEMLLDSMGDLEAPLPGPRSITLRGHQREDGLRLIHAKRAILAHDMGLGKSITSLVAARAAQIALDAHIFVIGPVSLRTNWLREAEEVGARIEFFSWAKCPEAIDGRPFVAIFDEAHYAQNLKAARTKKALALAERAVLAFFLTGTPIKNGRPVNLYPLLKGCNHPIAADKTAYEKRYCAARETAFTRWDVTGAAHLDELHERTKDVLFRKTKKQCLDLPPFMRIKRDAEAPADLAAAYYRTREEMIELIESRKRMGTLKGSEALEMLTALRVAGSRAKVAEAIALAEEAIEQGGAVIVSTQFQETAHEIAQALRCEVLTGETKADDRQKMVDRFQAGQFPAIVMTGGAGGVGLNLQRASTVILVDRPWTPGDAEQIEARAHRSGQENAVTSIWLQFEAVDHKVDGVLEAKAGRIELVLEGKRKTMRATGGSIASAAMEALGLGDLFEDDGAAA